MAKNQLFQSTRLINAAVAAGVVSGAPCLVGTMTGVAITTRDANGNATVDLGGVYSLSVKGVNDAGNVAIAIGDPLYYVDTDNPKISAKKSGKFFGLAWAAVGSGLTAAVGVGQEYGHDAKGLGAAGVSKSAELTGTGAIQNFAHGLGVVPSAVIVYPTDTSAATVGVYVVTEGAHDATNAIVTVTTGKKYRVVAFA